MPKAKSAKGGGPGTMKAGAVRTTMKPVFGKRSMGKRGGRSR